MFKQDFFQVRSAKFGFLFKTRSAGARTVFKRCLRNVSNSPTRSGPPRVRTGRVDGLSTRIRRYYKWLTNFLTIIEALITITVFS